MMRNEMQELNVKDWKGRLKAYLPQNVLEEADKRQILQEIRERGMHCCFGRIQQRTLPVPDL